MMSHFLRCAAIMLCTTLFHQAVHAEPDLIEEPGGASLIDNGYVVRGGLPYFIQTAQNQEQPATVAYLGGSITKARDGYCDQSAAWMRDHFGNSTIQAVNAGIGGTNSAFGAYRAGRDVLRHEPDLVFVEFAVNDEKSPDWMIVRAMEGIVRQVRQHNDTADICFLYTLKSEMIDDMLAGNLPRTVVAMETVADHYDIPSVLLGVDVVELIRADKMVVKGAGTADDAGRAVYSHDGVHPLSETGHKSYTEVLGRALEAMTPVTVPESERALPEPIDAKNLEHATIVPIDPERHLVGEWTKLDPSTHEFIRKFADTSPDVYRGSPGASLNIDFSGKAVGLCDIVGPSSGVVRYVLDGKDLGTKLRFDAYCTYYRESSTMIAERLADTDHQVQIEVVDQDLDKADILSKRSKSIDDPSRYEGGYFHVSGIMIDGIPAE